MYEINFQNGQIKVSGLHSGFFFFFFSFFFFYHSSLWGSCQELWVKLVFTPKIQVFVLEAVLHFVTCFICTTLNKFYFGRNQGIPGRRNIPGLHSWKWPPEGAGVWALLHLRPGLFRKLQRRAYVPQPRGSYGERSSFQFDANRTRWPGWLRQ